MDYKNLGVIVMKTEQEIKEKIKELAEKGSLGSFIGALMLCWVLDVDAGKVSGFNDKLREAVVSMYSYLFSME